VRVTTSLRAFAVAATLLLAASSAAAQPDLEEQGRALFQLGVDAAEDGRWEDALRAFERAYERLPHPDILMNLAAAQARTGRLVASAASYARLLGLVEGRPELYDVVVGAQARLAEETPAIRIRTVDPDETDQVRIDDRTLTNEELAAPRLLLDPGPHRAELVRDGRVIDREEFDLALRARAEVTLAPPTGGGSWADDVDWIFWSFVAAGMVGAVGTVYSGVRIGALNDDTVFQAYRQRIPPEHNACDRASMGDAFDFDPAEFQHVQDVCSEGRSLTVLQYVFAAVALAGGGAATVWALTRTSDDDVAPVTATETTAVAAILSPWLAADGGGVDLRIALP
jgi:hypothetical protein